jgi:hypothetical protein
MSPVRFVFAVTLSFTYLTAFANSYRCSGSIDVLFVTRSGNVEIYSNEAFSDSHGRVICNTSDTWKGVSSATCKVWYSALLTQSIQSKPAVLYYFDNEASSCSTIPLYGASTPPYGVSDK